MHEISVALLLSVSLTLLAYTNEVWKRDSASDALRAWWIDPAVATLGFNLAIDVFDRRERALGYASRPGFAKGLSLTTPGTTGMLLVAGVAYWAGVYLWVSVVPPPSYIPDGVPSSIADLVRLVIEVIGGVVAYDFVFCLVHLAMHHFSSAWAIHRFHHTEQNDLRARDVLTHSPIDGTMQVLVNILVQRHTFWGAPKSRVARALHNVIVTWMLTESHTASPSPRIARRFCIGVRRHRSHHVKGAPYYQQFFGYLDDGRQALFGKRIS